ncbi:histidinol dehydrogenase, partial [Microbacterium testaceum]
MLRTIDLRGRVLSPAELLAVVPRADSARDEALVIAARIVDDVAVRGEEALREQAAQFDHVTDHAIAVPASHLDEALDSLDPGVRAALEEA